MSKTKKVTISLTPEQQEKARFLSKDLFGKENISGLVGFLIERLGKEVHVTAIDFLKKEKDSWIHASEKLPNKGERVLCSSIYGIQIGWMRLQGDWEFSNGGSQFTLEYWMPLPSLPTSG